MNSIYESILPGVICRGECSACQKSLAEFAARRRQIELNHFLPGRVPGGKYLTGCKCASCPPSADKECAQQTAILLSKKANGFF